MEATQIHRLLLLNLNLHCLYGIKTHTTRDIGAHTQVVFGQIGVLFCHSSPESHFPSILSLWREGFLPAVFPEVKVIRPGMRSGLLDLPFLLFSPSLPFISLYPNCLLSPKIHPYHQLTSDNFRYFSPLFPSLFLYDPLFFR